MSTMKLPLLRLIVPNDASPNTLINPDIFVLPEPSTLKLPLLRLIVPNDASLITQSEPFILVFPIGAPMFIFVACPPIFNVDVFVLNIKDSNAVVLIVPGTIRFSPSIVVSVEGDPINIFRVEPPISKKCTSLLNNVAYVCWVDIELGIFLSVILSDPICRFDRVLTNWSISETVQPLYDVSLLEKSLFFIDIICPNLFIFMLLGYWYSNQLLSVGGINVESDFNVDRIFIGKNGSS